MSDRFNTSDFDVTPSNSIPSSTNSQCFIPPDLKNHLPHPKTPWLISEDLFQRLTPSPTLFKQAEIQQNDPEFNFVTNYFFAHKPDGYSISKITCIHNKLTTFAFEVELQTMEQEAHSFTPRWRDEPHKDQREAAIQPWKIYTDSFTPLEVPSSKKSITLSFAKVLPLWHGTTQNKATSICASGFTYFGKHHLFHPHEAQKGDFGSTDMGYFGSGIYFSSSAKYSNLYSQGHLLLSWVSMREPYPVISDIPHPTLHNKCMDMKILEGKGAYQTYNSHFIPVTSINPTNPKCMIYFPCAEGQLPHAEEFVVFQRCQTLPRFLIEISVDTPSFLCPKTTHVPYSPTTIHTSVRTGDMSTILHWIQEDPDRLMDKSESGETLWHAAVRGNQLQILQYLHTQDPQILKNQNGFTLLHLACTFGNFPIIQWIYQQAPELLKVSDNNNFTPAHVAAFHEHLQVLDLFDHLPPDLLTQLAKCPYPKALAHLLDRGLTPPVSSDNQTLLHLAAQSAQEENILVLLKRRFVLESQDLQGRTPIFLATLQGHQSIVKLLLEKGAHVDICSNEQETLLHVAAFYGYTQLLQDLLKHPDGRKLVSVTDVDGKTPLHKAVWGQAKPNIVLLLLKYGSDPNALNNYRYTPLHWAAKHGHVESAEILRKHNAHLDILNANNDTPLDLALHHYQDDVFHVLLGTTKQRLNTETPTKNEAFYFSHLRKARKKNFTYEQVLYLIKLSDLYHDTHVNHTTLRKNLPICAKFLNAALAVLEKSKSQCSLLEDSIFKRMENVEKHLLQSYKYKVENYPSLIKTFRAQLQTARNNCENGFKQQDTPQNISATLTQALKQVLIGLISTSQTFLGPPPVKWAAFTMGSMARGEMCPYSDIQFAFLVKVETPEVLTYFEILSKLLQLRIINMGETAFPVFGEYEDSPTPDGFCMDTEENTPFGVDLIGTPEKFASFQSLMGMHENIIRTNTLNCVCYLVGDTRLVQKYIERLRDKLSLRSSISPRTSSSRAPSPKFHQSLGIHLLNYHLVEFEPNLSTEKQQIKVFEIKKELHRPLQEILCSLTLFYNIQSLSSFDKVSELVKRKIFSKKGGENLKTVLNQVLSLRLQAHLFYKTEHEFLLPSEQDKTKDDKKLYLDETLLEKIQAIYSIIFPFHKCAKEFVATKEKDVCRIDMDKSPMTLGQYYEKTLQYKKAQEAYQQAVTLNPNDTSALVRLGLIESELGDSKTALKHAQKALEFSLQIHGENHHDVAIAYNNIGSALKSINIQGALDAHQKALKIFLAIFVENHPLVAISYNNNGITYNIMGNHQQALIHHQKALKIRLDLYGEIHPDVALSYNNIAGSFLNTQDSFNYAQKALNIKIAIYGVNHPELISSYDTLGRICCELEKVDETFQYYVKSLKIQTAVFGKNHPEVAKTFNMIGLALENLGKVEKAKEAIRYIQALDIVVEYYDNIGWALNKIGKAKDALENHHKALNIWLNLKGKTTDNDPTVDLIIHNIRLAHRTLGNVQESLVALKIQIDLYQEKHPDVAKSLSNLAELLQERRRSRDRVLIK